MLKNIDYRLNADVLYALRAMGHGDTLVISDTNFPADQVSRSTIIGDLLRMENLTAAQAANAVLSVFPLDTFVNDFAMRMEIVDDPETIPQVQTEVQHEINQAEGGERLMVGVERFRFYDLARQSYATIQTGETRFYGCFIFRKGVIPPNDGSLPSQVPEAP